MAIDVTANNLASWGIVAFGLLLNAGAFTFWMKNGTDIKVMARDMEDLKAKQATVLKDTSENRLSIGVLSSRVNQQDTIILEIRNHLVKLDPVPEAIASLVTSAAYIKEAVQNVVPREELNARLKSTDERIAAVEKEVQLLQK